MRVFISWSGETSRRCAEALRDWLPYMNQAIVPFVSSQDISKGERGLAKIADKLQDCTYGIVCVTRENQHAPWINFESGALSRELGETMLAPFLLDLPVKDLSGPIAQFQATEGGSRDEVWALVKSLNDKCETSIEQERLTVTFERFWGDLEEKLNEIRSVQPPTAVPERETSEILNELVALVREQANRMSSLEGSVAGLRGGDTVSHYTINEPQQVTIHAPQEDDEPERVSRMKQYVIESIGEEKVLGMRADGASLTVRTTPKGHEEARAKHVSIQEMAKKLGVSTQFHLSRGGSVDVMMFRSV